MWRPRSAKWRGVGRAGCIWGWVRTRTFRISRTRRPSLAILIDVRRDNLLLHLLFKAIFAEASIACGLPGAAHRTAAARGQAPTGRREPVDALVTYIDAAPRLSDAGVTALRGRLTAVIRGFGVALSDCGSIHHRPVSSAIHRRRPGASVQQHRPSAAVRLSDVSRSAAGGSIARARARISSRPNPTSSS
jgi:hypothetical protein